MCVCVCVQPQYVPEDVLYQGCVKFSCWYEQGKKFRERYIVLRRDCKVEIHENMEVTLAHTHTHKQNKFQITCWPALDFVVCVSTCRLSGVDAQLSWSSRQQGAECSPLRRSPELSSSKPVLEYSTVVFIYTYSIKNILKVAV